MSNNWDDDPFAENPEAEFAPTQAMDAVPGPGGLGRPPGAARPGAPGPGPAGPSAGQHPGRPGGPGPAPAAGRPPHAPTDTEPRRFHISAILSAVGSVLLIAAFFAPTLSITYLIGEFVSEGLPIDTDVLRAVPDGELPEEVKDAIAMMRDEFATDSSDEAKMAELFEIDALLDELEKAETGEDVVDAFESYNVSVFDATQLFMTLDFEGDTLGADKEARAGGRMIWMSFAWLPFTGLIALLLAGIGQFKPLGSFNIGWNGLLGFVWTGAGISMLAFNQESAVFDVHLFQGVGPILLLFGGLLLWASSFAAMNGKNWWKGLLIGLGLFPLMIASMIGPALVMAG